MLSKFGISRGCVWADEWPTVTLRSFWYAWRDDIPRRPWRTLTTTSSDMAPMNATNSLLDRQRTLFTGHRVQTLYDASHSMVSDPHSGNTQTHPDNVCHNLSLIPACFQIFSGTSNALWHSVLQVTLSNPLAQAALRHNLSRKQRPDPLLYHKQHCPIL